MGIFAPLIRTGLEIAPANVEASDRIATVPNGMTAARPALAIVAANMLLKGEHPVTPVVFVMGISDGEGNVARLGDRFRPDSIFGSSNIGAEIDPIADTAAMLIVSSAALFAPRMPVLGKAAIATALGHEGFKAAWALGKNRDYKAITGKRLKIKPTDEGKESMLEKFMAVGLATWASDCNNPFIRQTMSAAAMTVALSGTLRGESQRELYNEMANHMIREARNPAPSTV